MSVHSIQAFNVDGRLRGSYVYMLMCQDAETIYIKVGRSVSPLQRLSHLRTACPVAPEIMAIMEVSTQGRAGQIELALHTALSKWRTNGEWFRFQIADRPQFNAAWRSVIDQYSDSTRRLFWQKISVPEIVKAGRRASQYLKFQFARRGKAYRDFRNAT